MHWDISAVLALVRLNMTSPYHGILMKNIMFMILTVVGLSATLVLGNLFSMAMMQPLYSSPEEQIR